MDTNLARAADDLEIRRVLAQYCRGLDRMDDVLVESVFWVGAGGARVCCDGVFDGTAQDWIRFAFERGRRDLSTAHMLQQSLIEIDGETAEVETYFIIRYVYKEDDGVTIMVVIGRYADVFEKRSDTWKIAHRTIILDAPRHFDRQPAPTGGAKPIGRRDDDPTFQLSGLAGQAVPPPNA